jgi:TatD DNase family protein
VETKLQETNCLAVGECGLDKHISDRIATVGFRKTVGFGTKYNKPVVLHCVASFDELIATKKN